MAENVSDFGLDFHVTAFPLRVGSGRSLAPARVTRRHAVWMIRTAKARCRGKDLLLGDRALGPAAAEETRRSSWRAWPSCRDRGNGTSASLSSPQSRRTIERAACRAGLHRDLEDDESGQTPSQVSNLALVPISRLDRVSVRALADAVSLRQPVVALHVSPTEEESKRFREYWHAWGDHVPRQLVQSPNRTVIPPVVAYVESLHVQRPELTVTVIVPARDRSSSPAFGSTSREASRR